MSAVKKRKLLSVEEYLSTEELSDVKREYVGGAVYAMAGARNRHHIIAGNIFAALHAKLSGKKCQPYTSDAKVRIERPRDIIFYYPDVSVVCNPNGDDEVYNDRPVVVIEVLSKSTRRIDFGEKMEGYTSIPSLQAYLLVEQDLVTVYVYRRTTSGFVEELYEGLEAVIPLPEVGAELPLDHVYSRVKLEESDDSNEQ